MKIAIALLLAALAAGSSGKPKVEFKPTRAITQLTVGRCEALVTFRLKVADGGSDDYYCPRVVFEWEDGTRSSEESDCAPFEDAAATDHERTWTRSRGFQKPGTYLIRAHLCKASRRIKTIDTRAVIMGWDGYDPDRRQDSGCSAARPSGMGSPLDEPVVQETRASVKDPCESK